MQVRRFFGEVHHLSAIPSNHVIWMDRNISQGELLFVPDNFWWLTDLFQSPEEKLNRNIAEHRIALTWFTPVNRDIDRGPDHKAPLWMDLMACEKNEVSRCPWCCSLGWNSRFTIFFETFSYYVNNLSSMPLFVVIVSFTTFHNTNTTYSINLTGRANRNTSQ